MKPFCHGTVVAADVGRGGAGFGDDVLQCCDHVGGCERPARDDGQRGAGVFVDDIEEADVPPAGSHVRLEVEADHVHRVFGRQALLLPGAGTGPALLPRLGFTDEAFLAPEPAYAFVVEPHPSPLLGEQAPAGFPPSPCRMLDRDGA